MKTKLILIFLICSKTAFSQIDTIFFECVRSNINYTVKLYRSDGKALADVLISKPHKNNVETISKQYQVESSDYEQIEEAVRDIQVGEIAHIFERQPLISLSHSGYRLQIICGEVCVFECCTISKQCPAFYMIAKAAKLNPRKLGLKKTCL